MYSIMLRDPFEPPSEIHRSVWSFNRWWAIHQSN